MLRAGVRSLRRRLLIAHKDRLQANRGQERGGAPPGPSLSALIANHRFLFRLVATAFLAGLTALALWYAFPGAPRKVTMATAFAGSTGDYYGTRYKNHLARIGLELEQRYTRGAIENLALLKEPKSGVQIAFVSGGVEHKEPPDNFFSLGVVFETPFWLFYKSPEPLEKLSQLRGKRIAIGPLGSAFRAVAEQVLGAVGVDGTSATFMPVGGADVVAALAGNEVDVAWVGSRSDAAYIRALLDLPGVRLLSFDRVEALTKKVPYLTRYEIPQGGLDFAKDIPAKNTTLIAISTRVIVRHDLHPAVVTSLLEAMKKEHGKAGPFHRTGDFPKGADDEYVLAPVAVNYYKNGPSLIYSVIPLWMSGSALRLAALLAAVVPLIIFVISFEPNLFKWIIRHRVRAHYRQMREIERQLPTMHALEELVSSKARLEQLDKSASSIQVPLRHSDSLFTLKIHLHLLRTRIAARIEEVRARQKSG